MNAESQLRSCARPIGGADVKKPGVKVQIEGRSFAQSSQAEPIPMVWGSVQRSGTFIIPPFGVRAVEVTQKVGK